MSKRTRPLYQEYPMPEVMETPPNPLDIAYRWASYANAACTLPIITLCNQEDWPQIRELVNAHKLEYTGYPCDRSTDLVIEMHAVAALEAAAEYKRELQAYNDRNGVTN